MRRLIPNVITCLNMLLGFTAIIESGRSNTDTASVLVLVCVALDMIDGYMARYLHAVSPFGGELDSLADIMSFGAAPSVIIYHRFFTDSGLLGLLISAAPMIATGLRLARFNISAKSDEFCGLPCPAAALLLLSVSSWVDGNLPALTALTALCAVLMVSEFRYGISVSSKPAAICLIFAAVVTLIFLPHALSIWVVGYALSGPLKSGVQWAKLLIVPVRQLVQELSTPAAKTRPPVNRTL